MGSGGHLALFSMFSRGTIRLGMRPKVDMQRFKTFRGLRDDFSQLDLKKNLFENSQIRAKLSITDRLCCLVFVCATSLQLCPTL